MLVISEEEKWLGVMDRRQEPEIDDSEDATLERGTNQGGMRDRNERVVLSLLRRNSNLAKADIARRTGLSAQPLPA